MKSMIPIDKAGRVVLPRQARRQFHLVAGDLLGLEIVPEGIFLRAQARPAALVEEHGLLVHDGDSTDDLSRAIDRIRNDRDENVLGIRR